MPFAVDRVECAVEAMSLGLTSEPSIDPAPVEARPLPAPAPVPAFAGAPVLLAGAASVRPQMLAGANLALLAAGATATIYLWLRVFGADLTPIFPADSASPAFERGTVAATIDLTPPAPPESRPLPESQVRGGGSQPAVVLPVSASTPAPANRRRSTSRDRSNEPANGRTQRDGGPVVRPSEPPPPPPPPAEPAPPRSAPVPTFPVPSSPPADRIPGPTLPGSGSTPEQPTLASGGGRG